MDNSDFNYTPAMRATTRRRAYEYRRELMFVARFFKTTFRSISVWYPFLFMSYKTAAEIMRKYGEAEYRRGAVDALDQIMNHQ
jgi:hypothetical protein